MNNSCTRKAKKVHGIEVEHQHVKYFTETFTFHSLGTTWKEYLFDGNNGTT
uniref:Uncharacterized protein n=1 Tax=Tetranychus urticae TaxID=32264 RepID=T1L4R9_TETUR